MGFLSGLKKKVEGVVAQVNPLDNGRTYSTVMQHGADFAPKAPASAFQQATHNGASNVIGGALKAPVQFANTANLAGHELFDTAKMYTAQATHNPTAFHNASLDANKHYQQLGNQHSGLLGQGTFFHNPDEAKSGSFKIVAPRILGGTLQTGATVVPVGGGALAKGALGIRIAKGAGSGAIAGGFGTAGNDLVQTGHINAQDVLKGAGIGAALGGATPLVKPAIQAGANAVKPIEIPEITALKAQKQRSIDAYHNASSPKVAQTHIANVNNIDQQIRQIQQAGAIGKNVPGNVPKTSHESIAPENLNLYHDAQERVFAQNPLNGLIDPRTGKTSLREGSAPRATQSEPPAQSVGQILGEQSPLNKQSTGNLQITPAYSRNSLDNIILPEYGTKQVSNLDKALRDTQSIIERQGEHGKKLSDMLDTARDNKEIYLGGLQKQLPTVQALKKGEFENFVEATQGHEKPLNSNIKQAIKEWQTLHPTIRDRGVKAGLEIGDLGPTYYPHFIDFNTIFRDKNTYNTAINHLVETGQAKNPDEAIQLLGHARDVSRNRQFGNLEASRMLDLPFYDRSPESLANYLNSSAKRITDTETFGKGDENALKLISQAGLKGYDTEAMKNAYDIAVGARQYNPTTSAVSGHIRGYLTTTRLGLGAITNVGQSINTGIVTGHLRTMGSMLKQLDPQTRSFVADTGVIADAVIADIKRQAGFVPLGGRVGEHMTTASPTKDAIRNAAGTIRQKITAPGFAQVEKFNRSVAATAGRDYGLRLAQKGDIETLRRLGVKGPIKNGTLTHDQQVQIARKVVEKTQFKVDPQDLPGWADSPGGKLVAQFRTFSYNQGKFFSNEIVKPAAHGNLVPLARLMAALPVGYAIYDTKRTIAGRPQEQSPARNVLEAFNSAGGAGLAVDAFRGVVPLNNKSLTPDRRVSMAAGVVGGPAVGSATEIVGALSNAMPKALGGSSKPEQLARVGLRQIPVVGTAIQNRVIPYKSATTTSSNSGIGSSKAGAGSTIAPLVGIKHLLHKDSMSLPEENLTSADRVKIAMGSPEAKAFLKLSEADQRAAAQSDPTARKLYEEKKAIQGAFKTPDLHPDGLDANFAKQELGVDLDPVKTLDHFNRLSSKARETVFNKQKDAEFKYKASQYLEDVANGKIDDIDKIKKQNEIAKLYVGKDFDKRTRDEYGLNKTEIMGYMENNNDGNGITQRILAYDDALVKAGVIKKNKFRDKYGNPDFDPSSSSSGGKKKGSGRVGKSKNGGIALPSISMSDSMPSAKAGIRLASFSAPSGATALKKPDIKISSSGRKTVKMTAKKIAKKQ
jgi:hypothetical protein